MPVSEDDVASIDDFLMGMLTGMVGRVKSAVERKEPRCRICRDEAVRVLVNELLDWHGTQSAWAPASLTWSPAQTSCVSQSP
jgi:hypothetical protein